MAAQTELAILIIRQGDASKNSTCSLTGWLNVKCTNADRLYSDKTYTEIFITHMVKKLPVRWKLSWQQKRFWFWFILNFGDEMIWSCIHISCLYNIMRIIIQWDSDYLALCALVSGDVHIRVALWTLRFKKKAQNLTDTSPFLRGKTFSNTGDRKFQLNFFPPKRTSAMKFSSAPDVACFAPTLYNL